MKRILAGLRSLALNVAFFGWTFFLCFGLLWFLLLPKRMLFYGIRFWQNHLSWIERNIGGIRYQVIGLEHIPEGACIIAAKHQSAWETCKLHLMFYDPAIVLKEELLRLPVWGWYAKRSGMIPIDRGGRSKTLTRMMEAARQAKADGRNSIIFPQGTRLIPGDKKPYKV